MRGSRIAAHGAFALLFGLCLLPLGFVVHEAATGEGASLLASNPAMVADMLGTTLQFAGLTVAIALALGYSAAWCVVRLPLPARGVWSVLLCLPFAIPPYLLSGIARTASYQPWFPRVEHLWAAALIMGLTLYPWVYVPVKAALMQQSARYQEAGRSLGLGPWRRWWRIELPLLLPTLGLSLLLVFMAVIGDLGVATQLGLKTLSVGIDDAQNSMYRSDWAGQLALIAMTLPLIAVIAFAWLNRRRATYNPSNRPAAPPPRRVHPAWIAGACAYLGALLVVALVAPVAALVWWSLRALRGRPIAELPGQVVDTALVTGATTAITVVLALAVAVAVRRSRALAAWRWASPVLLLNYALPGVMLAIALLFASATLPEAMTAGLLSNSVGLVVIGLCLAYLCFPFAAVRSGQATIPPRIDDLARTLGLSSARRLYSVELPLLRPFIAAGILLVAVNVAKEVPISEVLQPFGYSPLSRHIHDLAKNDNLRGSAIYGLTLVLLLIYPTIALDRIVTRERHAVA